MPQATALAPAYPNPFQDKTSISFSVVSGSATTRLIVYNMLGQEVDALVNGMLSPGDYVVQWEAGDLVSGAYLLKLETAQAVQTQVVVKR